MLTTKSQVNLHAGPEDGCKVSTLVHSHLRPCRLNLLQQVQWSVFNGQREAVCVFTYLMLFVCVSVNWMFSVSRNISLSLLTVQLMLPHHSCFGGWRAGPWITSVKGLCLFFFLEIFISRPTCQ